MHISTSNALAPYKNTMCLSVKRVIALQKYIVYQQTCQHPTKIQRRSTNASAPYKNTTHINKCVSTLQKYNVCNNNEDNLQLYHHLEQKNIKQLLLIFYEVEHDQK